MIPLMCGGFGAWYGAVVNLLEPVVAYEVKQSFIGRHLYIFLNQSWLFEKVYNNFIGRPILNFAYQVSFRTLDKGFFELVGPSGVIRLMPYVANRLSTLQSGYIYHYALVILLGLTCFIAVNSLTSFNFDLRLLVLYPLICLF
jgi:NADH:ubiquinone oxidoreductase subunit 5 (subunit L)/multisubunit Na+/H+ antiporter MnhA subunit